MLHARLHAAQTRTHIALHAVLVASEQLQAPWDATTLNVSPVRQELAPSFVQFSQGKLQSSRGNAQHHANSIRATDALHASQQKSLDKLQSATQHRMRASHDTLWSF